MARFSKASLEKLETCDKRLIEICKVAIELIDFTVICGHRTREEQNKAYQGGYSKLNWPDSKHNKNPSLAVDIAPYDNGIDWKDIEGFKKLAEIIFKIANEKNIKIRWGGDFNMNHLADDKFFDFSHFELV